VTVFIMQSLNQNFHEKRLERYLTLAWQSGETPPVILTKADLVDGYGMLTPICCQVVAKPPVGEGQGCYRI